MNKYPAHWVPTTINETGQYINGFGFGQAHRENVGRPIIRIQNLTNPNAAFNFTTFLPDEKYLVNPGTILVSWSATLDAFIWNGKESLLNQHIFKVIPNTNVVEKNFLYFLLKTVISDIRESGNLRGTTMRHINRKPFLEHPIALPSLSEQLAISEAIQTAFSLIEKAEKKLARVFSQMSELRKAVFREATRGELTASWRQEQSDTESGEKLLERAADLRRFRWEQRKQQEIWNVRKEIKNEAWKRKYKKPIAYDTLELPNVPANWAWASLDEIAEIKSGLTINRQDVKPEIITVPYLRVANVQRGYLDLNDLKTISVSKKELEELRLEHGDILFNEGGDRDKLGRGWVWEDQLSDCIHQNHVFRARLVTDEIEPRFVSIWGNTFGQQYFEGVAKQTTNLASISLGKLARLPIPIPPLQEQQQILSKIEKMLDLVDEQEKELKTKIEVLEFLRKRILSQAFSGNLVPPHDPLSAIYLPLQSRVAEHTDIKTSSVRPNSRNMSEKQSSKSRSLKDIIADSPDGISPTELLRSSNYSLRQVDAFYEELSSIMTAGNLEQVGQDDHFEPLLRLFGDSSELE